MGGIAGAQDCVRSKPRGPPGFFGLVTASSQSSVLWSFFGSICQTGYGRIVSLHHLAAVVAVAGQNHLRVWPTVAQLITGSW